MNNKYISGLSQPENSYAEEKRERRFRSRLTHNRGENIISSERERITQIRTPFFVR